jgi:mRNA interferase MazF
MTFMPSYLKNEVLLVRYPFTDLTQTKVRPAVVVQAPHSSSDVIVVPLTSQTLGLRAGEFVLADWSAAGLHVPTAVKRGVYTLHPRFVLQQLKRLSPSDSVQLEQSLRNWLGL